MIDLNSIYSCETFYFIYECLWKHFTEYLNIYHALGTLAIAIPKLGLFLSFIGATFGSMACLILPAFIEIATHYSYCSNVRKWVIIKDIIIIIIGFSCGITGTYTTVYGLVLAFNGHSNHHQNFSNITQI